MRSTKVIGVALLAFPSLAAARTIDVQSWYGNESGTPSQHADVQIRNGSGGKTENAQWIGSGNQTYRTQVKAPTVKQVPAQPKQPAAATGWSSSVSSTVKRSNASNATAAKAATAQAAAHAKTRAQEQAQAQTTPAKARKVSPSAPVASKSQSTAASKPAARRVAAKKVQKAPERSARRVKTITTPADTAPALAQTPVVAAEPQQPAPVAQTDVAAEPAAAPPTVAAFVDPALSGPVPALTPAAAPYPTGESPAATAALGSGAATSDNSVAMPLPTAAPYPTATGVSMPLPTAAPYPTATGAAMPVAAINPAPAGALPAGAVAVPGAVPGQTIVYVPVYVPAPAAAAPAVPATMPVRVVANASAPETARHESLPVRIVNRLLGSPADSAASDPFGERALAPMPDLPVASTEPSLPALVMGDVPAVSAAAPRTGIGSADAGDPAVGPCQPTLSGAVPCADTGEVRAVAMDNYRFIPSRVEADANIASTPAQEEIVKANQDGDYGLIARKGEAALKTGTAEPGLRMIVANSLAWTGKLDRADTIYKTLLDTSYRSDAQAAMANIMRWRGKDYLAIPMYRAVLAEKPGHEDARAGLQGSLESLRPMMRTEIGGGSDIDDVRSGYASVRYREYMNDGKRFWELEGRHSAANISNGPKANQLSLTGRLQAFDLPMQPLLELTMSDRVYGKVTVTPIAKLPVQVHVGSVNWGEMANNPRALDRRLSATNVGVSGQFSGGLGAASFAIDQYSISDGNRLSSGMLRYSPPFGLFTKHIKPVIGMEFRESRINTPAYWSPDTGYGSGFVGLEGDWAGDKWSFNGGIQRGTRLWGEAGMSWGGSLSANYKLNKDWKVGGGAWAISNMRDGKPYRARTGYLYLERRW